jgi:pyruvate/2-oxoglutarate dehydrogenase complex dihydrolipoamide acyltransferase (E2) component
MATEVRLPESDRVEMAIIVRWLRNEGQLVHKGEPLLEVETEKALTEIPALETGTLSNISAKPGDEVAGGKVLALLLSETERTAVPDTQSIEDSPARKIRRLATMEPGRHLETSSPSGAAKVGNAEYRVVPLKGMRRTIAERLQASYQTAPHISLALSINTSGVRRVIEQSKNSGSKLTLTAIILKAVAAALRLNPRLNAHLIDQEIREFHAVHLGVAVGLEDGLVVPVIRNVERKDGATVQSELNDLSSRARSGLLQAHEMKGSTFTISNLGMFGIEHFSSILNPPEVGILSVGAIKETPVVRDGQIVSEPIMCVTLNADHRAVDGICAAKWLNSLKGALVEPRQILDGSGS